MGRSYWNCSLWGLVLLAISAVLWFAMLSPSPHLEEPQRLEREQLVEQLLQVAGAEGAFFTFLCHLYVKDHPEEGGLDPCKAVVKQGNPGEMFLFQQKLGSG